MLKKKLQVKTLTLLGVNRPVYINDSLCIYCKKLWAKCKKFHCNKLINAFWTSNGFIKLKVSENGDIHLINHDIVLEELFPGNELIRHAKGISSVYPSWVYFSQLVFCVWCLTFNVKYIVIFGGISSIRILFLFFCNAIRNAQSNIIYYYNLCKVSTINFASSIFLSVWRLMDGCFQPHRFCVYNLLLDFFSTLSAFKTTCVAILMKLRKI